MKNRILLVFLTFGGLLLSPHSSMKNKFLLIFLAVNGLFISSSASHAATSNQTKTDDLSSTITQVVKMPTKNQDLIKAAIDRALIARQISNDQKHVANTVTTSQKKPGSDTTDTRAISTQGRDAGISSSISALGDTAPGYRTPNELQIQKSPRGR
jgi:hypothetical protein